MSKPGALAQLTLSPPEGEAAAAPQHSTVVRHVLVQIAGSRLSWFNGGAHAALWRINPEHAPSIFAPDQAVLAAPLQDQLRRALVRRVTLLESNSNLDDVVGVVIDGLPPREFTRHGDGANVYLTGAGRDTAPQEIFTLSSESDLGLAWMSRFPNHTRDNLEVEGVMRLDDCTFYFVREDHPIMYIVSLNKDTLGPHVERVQKGWFQVGIEVYSVCIRVLREGVLRHAPTTFDLTGLTVRLVRPDQEPWIKVHAATVDALMPPGVLDGRDPAAIQTARAAALERYVERPLRVTLRLAVEYTLPTCAPMVVEEDATAAVAAAVAAAA